MNNNQPITRREFLRWILAMDETDNKLNDLDLDNQK